MIQRSKPLLAVAAAVTLLCLQGDATPSEPNTPTYESVSTTGSAETPICTDSSGQVATINFDCLHSTFSRALAVATKRVMRATITINLYTQLRVDGDFQSQLDESAATATVVSPTQFITAGHVLPKNSSEREFGVTVYTNKCSNLSNVQRSTQQGGSEVSVARWWDNYLESDKRNETPDLAKLETISDPDIAVGEVATGTPLANLPEVTFSRDVSRTLKTGDELLVLSDQPNVGLDEAMRNEVSDPIALAPPDVVDAVYLGINRSDPATFFVLTGIGSQTPEPKEPTVVSGGGSGGSVILADGGEAMGIFIGGRHNGITDKPIAVSGKQIKRLTGVRIVTRHDSLAPKAYLDLVQMVPPSGKLPAEAARACVG